MRALSAFFGVLTLMGCAVGPDFDTPAAPQPAAWSEDVPQGPAAVTPDLAWWQQLNDPLLTELIDEALARNHDIRLAGARLRQARSERGVAAGGLWPDISGAASQATQRASANQSEAIRALNEGGLIDLQNEFYQAGFDAAWELDIFGGTRRAVEATAAQAEARLWEIRAARISVAAETARWYTELRSAQERLAILGRNIRLQEETLALIESRVEAGLAPRRDAALSARNLERTRAQAPPQRASVRLAAYRLGVLTGQPPAALLDRLTKAAPLPEPADLVPLGLPSDLLRRRPDIRTAEAELHAATADVGVAVADLFPKVSLTGSLAIRSVTFSDLFATESVAWTYGPQLTLPIFQGGRLRARVAIAEARQEEAALRYEQAVLLAFEEVEGALTRYGEEQIRRRRLAAAQDRSEEALTLSRRLYESGLDDILATLDSEQALLAVEDELVQSETAVLTALISVYKALGGGWSHAPAQTAQAQGF